MARGFESKSVSDQQDEAVRRRERDGKGPPPISARRRTLELARADVRRRLAAAPEAHRATLTAALAALDEQLRRETPEPDASR